MQNELLEAFNGVISRLKMLAHSRYTPKGVSSYIKEFLLQKEILELLRSANSTNSEITELELLKASYQELKDECNRLSLENTLLKSKTTISEINHEK